MGQGDFRERTLADGIKQMMCAMMTVVDRRSRMTGIALVAMAWSVPVPLRDGDGETNAVTTEG
jgi:hypothetical protein